MVAIDLGALEGACAPALLHCHHFVSASWDAMPLDTERPAFRSPGFAGATALELCAIEKPDVIGPHLTLLQLCCNCSRC
jgi:hypothetical protein